MPIDRPDILLFISDQHDARRMGWVGDPVVQTPHLDAIAANGVACTAAYCNSPLCVPSRSALMSGQLPSQTGIISNGGELPGDTPTIAHLLGAEGYRTTLCGRMHFHHPAAMHGFDRQLVGDMTASNWGHDDFYRALEGYGGNFAAPSCLGVIGGGGVSPVLSYDDAVIGGALADLGEVVDQPEFMVVGTYGPHFPYVAEAERYQHYRDQAAVSLAADPQTRDWEAQWLSDRQHQPDEETRLAARTAYLAMIATTDAHVGAVRQAFKDRCQRAGRPWLFIYASDHGDHNGEYRLYGKQTMLEASARVPLVIEGTAIAGGRQCHAPVSLVDVLPTLLDVVGAPAYPATDGHSFWPLLRGEPNPPVEQRRAIAEYVYADGPARMLRQGAWKLIRQHRDDGVHDWLFDLASDPGETTNRAADEPARVAELGAALMQGWQPAAVAQRHARIVAGHPAMARWSRSRPEGTTAWTGYRGKLALPTTR